MSEKADIYSEITNQIIAELEAGVLPWRKPWQAGAGNVLLPVRVTGENYRGINIVMLWLKAHQRGYASPSWMTFRQALELGANVRKGERGTRVVYADKIIRTEQNEAGEDEQQAIPFLKAYTVFNVEQIDGLPERFAPAPLPVVTPINPDSRNGDLDKFFTATGADIRHGGEEAFFASQLDYVEMPVFSRFRNAQSYYAALAHELVHWTGHASRLDRTRFVSRYGTADYAREELVAELGSAFLCADLGLEPETREDHAPYIQSWLKALKDDKRCIFGAAAHASRAVEFILARARPTS